MWVCEKNVLWRHAYVTIKPFFSTVLQIRRRNNFEDRIHEVEEGIKAFSRQRVLVKL